MYYAMREIRKPAARGASVKAEEVGRGREQSGWNPYAGEEESPEMRAYDRILAEEQEAERELRKLQSMYPEAAKLMLPYVEEACDRMEYEGSPMFDECPDRTTVYRAEEYICDQVRDRFPGEPVQEPEEVLSMQYPGPGAGGTGRNRVRDLARVLLLQEMHHRRRRYHRRKTGLPFPTDSGIV